MTPFLLPLTGKEAAERLEGKYKGLLDSEDDEEEGFLESRERGKVSQWMLHDGSSTSHSQWLHSPSKKHANDTISGKRYTPQGAKPRRTLQAQKKSVVTRVKHKDVISKSTPSKSNDVKSPSSSRHVLEKHSKDHNNSHTSHHNEDSDTAINEYESDEERSKETKEKFTSGENAKELDFFLKGNEGFSIDDTEKPKLSVRPVAAKIDFQLSADGEEPVIRVPGCINQYLRDYQRDGVCFLYQHYVRDKGAILGDDMGLGKTVQVIAFLSALLGKEGNHRDAVRALPRFIRELSLSPEDSDSPPRVARKPFLIVAPSAVMYSWLEHFETWGYFSTSKFHGLDKENSFTDAKKGKVEIVVTTFETFRDNVDRLSEIEWEAVIVDEVHKIKGLKAQISKALGQISTPCRYGLTGTALQNSLIELWSILDWAQPGILGSPEKFQTRFIHAIEKGQRHDASKRDLALARQKKDKFAEIRKGLLLRRTKALIADQLPSKVDQVVMCRLTDFQVCVYKAILNQARMSQVLAAEDPCDCGRKKLKASCCYKRTKDGVKIWSLVFSYMHLLLKAANHCALLMPDGKTSDMQTKHVREVCEEVLKDFPQFVEQSRDAAFLTLSDPKYCGKMKILQGLLSVFSNSHDKVLVFSYSTRLLDIIEQYIISKCYEFRRIDGKTSSQKRMEIVHQFNADPDIFLCLISTKAGGLGLNLTGANRVVIFDPNWNPSHDLQAQDRAYRIGQTRDVKVYRLVSAGTIEENIYLRQIYKQQLDEVAIATGNAKRYFHGIQGDKGQRGELFGVKNMFTLRTGDTCLTMDILKRNEKLEKELAGYDIARYVPSTEGDNSNESGSGDDDETAVDDATAKSPKEDEDEEDVFLQAMFGKDRTTCEESRSSVSPSMRSPTKDKPMPSTSKGIRKSESDSSSNEDDDFFLPKIYSRSKKDNKNLFEEKETSRNLFTVDEITFSKSAFNTVYTQKRKSPLKVRKTATGLSCLFPDSESDEVDDDKNERGEVDDNKNDVIKGDNDEKNRSEKTSRKDGKGLSKMQSSLSWLFTDSDDSVEESDEKEENIESKTFIKEKKMKVKVNSAELVKEGKGPASSATSTSSRVVKRTGQRPKDKSSVPGTSKSHTQFDSVKAVFEECGVVHIHGNKEFVGSSRAEDHMTKCAMQEVFEMDTNTQLPAVQCDPLPPQPSESEDEPKGRKKRGKKEPPDHNTASSTKVGAVKILLGQTPPGVRRLVWDELCKSMGEGQLILAQKMSSCGPEERLQVLRDFYTKKHPQLEDTLSSLLKIKTQNDTNTSTEKPENSEKASSSSLKKASSPRKRSIKNKSSPSSKCKQRRQLEISSIVDHVFLESESQESITAHSHPQSISLSLDKDSEGFLPAPPPRRPRNLLTPTKPKSATTRTRQKMANKVAREKMFNKPPERKGIVYSNEEEEEDGGKCDEGLVPSLSCNKTDDHRVQLDSYESSVREGISSLLMEMGNQSQFESSPPPEKNRGVIFSSTCDIEATEAYQVSPTPCSSKQVKSPCRNTREKQHPERRNYASILDDIFDRTIDTGSVNSKVCEIELLENDDVDRGRRQSPRKRPRGGVIIDEEKPSTSTTSSSVGLSRTTKSPCLDKDESRVVHAVREDSDDDDVDALFQTSTLKEDSPRSSKRKQQCLSPVKGKRGSGNFKKKLTYYQDKESDALDLGGNNSESLFS